MPRARPLAADVTRPNYRCGHQRGDLLLYDGWGVPTTNTESFPGRWSSPSRYGGRDPVRYDTETSLYWPSVRATRRSPSQQTILLSSRVP
jgi:hypothetical protein